MLESDMWKDPSQKPRKIPDLRVYITNVWPRSAASLPQDHDRTVERSRDMLFLDKTDYDEKVASLVDDYISLVKEMRKLGSKNAKDKAVFDKEVAELIGRTTTTTQDRSDGRKYIDLIKGRMDVRVHRIQLAADNDSISGKFFDFSHGTIAKLLQRGYEDGQRQFKDMFSDIRT